MASPAIVHTGLTLMCATPLPTHTKVHVHAHCEILYEVNWKTVTISQHILYVCTQVYTTTPLHNSCLLYYIWIYIVWKVFLDGHLSHYRSILKGFSRRDLNTASHLAPTAPSTTRWSQLKVTVITLATRWLKEQVKGRGREGEWREKWRGRERGESWRGGEGKRSFNQNNAHKLTLPLSSKQYQ